METKECTMENLVVNSSVPDSTFWKGKKVLITGVGGFIGSNLAASLLEKGSYVTGLVRDKTPISNLKISGIDSKITIVWGELQDYNLMERVITKYKIEYIFHLGAQAIVALAQQSPVSTFESNIRGTWCLLEAARCIGGLKGIIVASSDKAYGKHKDLPYTEDFCLAPTFPYDISKACTDLIARGYSFSYELPVAVLRCANTYGEGDVNLSRIIPDTIYSLMNGQNPIIRSDGTPIRDYLYVDDAVLAYLSIARAITNSQIQGQAFNVGTNKPLSVNEVVEKLLKISGKTNLKPKILGKSIPHGEIDHQYLNSKKIDDLIGWEYKTPPEKGLQKTWDWWAKNWDLLKGLRTI